MNWIHNRTERSLVILGLNVIGSSAMLLLVSQTFEFDSPILSGPLIPAVLTSLIASSLFWLLACWLTTHVEESSRKHMLWWIVGVGIVSRIVLLSSTPILEIDLYRYIWDGNVAAATGAPYKYAPNEFNQLAQLPTFSRSDADRVWLNEFASAQDESMQQTLQILSQHFGQYTSPYPPASQAVFAASHYCCPAGSSLKTRVVVLKTFIVLFDIATGIVLILILRTLKLPETMSVVWFWSPLVLKEFANSGHLDSIAICFCSLFVLFTVKQIQSSDKKKLRYALIAAVFLSLGIAAKIYPAVLFLLWSIMLLRELKTKAIWPISLVVVVTGILLFPMYRGIVEYQTQCEATVPKPGVLAFAESWEMNDFLFMVVVENLKPPAANAAGETSSPWFVVTPESWRSNSTFSNAFLNARRITMLALLAIIFWLASRWLTTEQELQPQFFVECVFLTLAWFWLLSPTQNPWYWCWALPFLPFARSRAWYLVAVMTLLYYLRPWYTFNKFDITDFDHIVPVIEFAPILILLFASFLRSGLSPAKNQVKMEVPLKSEN